jgi:hypothetical protein
MKFIDISYANANVDLSAMQTLKQAGYEGVIIRFGYYVTSSGAFKIDDLYRRHCANATKAGLKIGLYVYGMELTVDQIDVTINALQSENPALDLPVFYDVEDSRQLDKVTAATLSEIVKAFSLGVQNAGYSHGLYASPAVLNKFTSAFGGLNYGKLWVAAWTNNPNKISQYVGTFDADFWQWGVIYVTGKPGIVNADGTVPNGSIDSNIMFDKEEKPVKNPDEIYAATAKLNVREAPSISAKIVTTIPANSVVFANSARISADNYRWAMVKYNDKGDTGYAADEWLRSYGSAEFDVEMQTVCAVRFRSAPTLSATVLTVLPTETTVFSQSEPTTETADGYDWTAVKLGDVIGWVAGLYLKKV